MCGLAGLISLTAAPPDRELVTAMVARLRHRGPDDAAVHVDGPVAFGHARLSLIDLAGGQQPLFNEDHSIAVICNGEIYNHRELRRQLERDGHRFATHSDCEPLVHLWERRGRELTDHLNGMYAGVIYDRRQNVVFGFRDPFGQKPLFYHHGQRVFAFASELKALLLLPDVQRELDPSAVDEFLSTSYVASPRTMFRSIKRLPAGGWFELQLETSQRPASLSLGMAARPRRFVNPQCSRAEQVDQVAAELDAAVERHLIADVPVGVFLSGGIDSGLITAIASRKVAAPLNTFAITFPGHRYDEGPKARVVAEACHTRHHEFAFGPQELQTTLCAAVRQFDQPLANTSVLPLMHLAREAATHVKAVLTGDGGDELFAGYRKYRRCVGYPGKSAWWHRTMANVAAPQILAGCAPDAIGTRRLRARVLSVLAPASRSLLDRQGWEGWERHGLYHEDFRAAVRQQRITALPSFSLNNSPLRAALDLDQGPALADRLLHKADHATMAYGLEARAPFLDRDLASLAGTLPNDLLVTRSATKVALRLAAERLLPPSIVQAPKKGFTVPLDDWLRGELQTVVCRSLLDEAVYLPRFCRRRPIERLLAAQARGHNHGQRIFSLFMLELWCREYL